MQNSRSRYLASWPLLHLVAVYSMQTMFSRVAMCSAGRVSNRFATAMNALRASANTGLSEHRSLKAAFLPRPGNALVVSHPVKAWKPGSALLTS